MTVAQVIVLKRGVTAEPWISKRTLAAHYGRSTRWIELRMREGMPSRMLGGRRAFQLSQVEAWMGVRFG